MKYAPSTLFRLLAVLSLSLAATAPLLAQRPEAPPPATSSLLVKAAPGAIIWVDSVRYGAVPESGELKIKHLRAGVREVRARLKGKREVTQTVSLTTGAQRALQISFAAPASEAELRFQEAEELRERGNHTAAIQTYRQAIKLRRAGYPAARVGLARSLMAIEEFEEAVAEAQRAAREQPGRHPEAHTVIANTKRAQGLYDDALISYRTALAQARDLSHEAHTGLALTYQELNQVADAIKHFRLAAAQGGEAEPVIYYLLGSLLDRERRAKEAIAAYEKYLQLEPQGKFASAVRSMLKQLQREIQLD
jgi:tetratricopeptide (TPR) repeat protein